MADRTFESQVFAADQRQRATDAKVRSIYATADMVGRLPGQIMEIEQRSEERAMQKAAFAADQQYRMLRNQELGRRVQVMRQVNLLEEQQAAIKERHLRNQLVEMDVQQRREALDGVTNQREFSALLERLHGDLLTAEVSTGYTVGESGLRTLTPTESEERTSALRAREQRGRVLTSEEFAERERVRANERIRTAQEIAGAGEEVDQRRAAARERLMVTEQLYRDAAKERGEMRDRLEKLQNPISGPLLVEDDAKRKEEIGDIKERLRQLQHTMDGIVVEARPDLAVVPDDDEIDRMLDQLYEANRSLSTQDIRVK